MPLKNCSNAVPNDPVKWHENFTGAFRLYVSPTIALFGIIGNIFVIVVFLLELKKSRFSIYCVAISSTHIVILLVNTFMDDFMGGGLKYRNPEFYVKFDTYSLLMCQVMEFMHNVMYTTSSGLLLVFSLDRIVTIFRPMQFYSIHYRRFAVNTCLVILIVGALTNIPLLLSSQLRIKPSKKCSINDRILIGKASIFIKVFVTFVVPTFIILFLNIVICLKLWRAKIQRAHLLPSDLQKNNLEMNRICGHLALNSVFLLFTMPLVIAMLLRQTNDCVVKYKSLSKMFSSLKDVSYALDFMLYFVFLTNFRWRFIRYFVEPILRLRCLKNTRLYAYIEVRVRKYDSNSSRRKYSAIAVGLSSCNNPIMFSALMIKPNAQFSQYKPARKPCVSYTNSLCSTPGQTPTVGKTKSVSYALDVRGMPEEARESLNH